MPLIVKPQNINKIWSSAGDRVSPSDQKINQGWVPEIPPHQWFNYIDNKQDQAIAHINQMGIPQWDSVTEYQANKSYVQGPTNGIVYRATQTAVNQNPETTSGYWTRAFIDQASNDLVPAGAVMSFAMNQAPAGWLMANGAAVSRAEYSRLFAAIGTTHGSGNGSTTFNLPDLRGEFVRGWDNGRGVDTGRTLGSRQGDLFRAHNHTASTGTAGRHRHGLSIIRANASTGNYLEDASSSAEGLNRFNYTDYEGEHNHSVTVNNNGGAETRPRNVALLYCVKY